MGRLKSGLPRALFADARCSAAARLRRDVAGLQREHPGAPPADLVLVAIAHGRWIEAEGDLSTSRARRESGQGRRPSSQTVARLQKRAALERYSYQQALDKLRERHPRKPLDLAQAIAAAQREAGQ